MLVDGERSAVMAAAAEQFALHSQDFYLVGVSLQDAVVELDIELELILLFPAINSGPATLSRRGVAIDAFLSSHGALPWRIE
jgi:hypothetical protein